MLLKLFYKLEKKGAVPNSFYVAGVTLIPKSDKDLTKTEHFRSISPMNIDAKVSTYYLQTESNNRLKMSYTMIKLVSF
jgi:hypothetical protein